MVTAFVKWRGSLGFIAIEIIELIGFIFINSTTKLAFCLRGGNEIPA